MLQQPSKHDKYVSSNECRAESSPRINNRTTNIFERGLFFSLSDHKSPTVPHSVPFLRRAGGERG